ncbi:cysteine hydrolase [Nocardioides mangrovicus]|uniref:Cysteine hydrolase n=1 Tax=Nocardioides mangrovicus TaxID=2478913 RepID=A0A3L8P0T6_9ACTN|nr:cysteine hydrolase [Nocardioides mangrovicus]RLV47998.1 cysteine hydrolase [Nocardioides mangrovicus]
MSHLVVVDLQRVFAAGPWGAPRFASILDPVARLVAEHEPHVTFTRFVAPATPTGAWVEYYEQWPFALAPPDDPQYELVEPYTDRPALVATTFGKWGPTLAVHREIVVCGVATDCCVVSTVLAAADAGVKVRVVADACAGSSDAAHEQALAIMASYAPLVSVE